MEIFDILGAAFPPPASTEVKFCTAKRTKVPVGRAKFDVNRCNESPLRGEKPDFWPVTCCQRYVATSGKSFILVHIGAHLHSRQFNTGSLPLCGILQVITFNR